jgi:putative acetyltransferase
MLIRQETDEAFAAIDAVQVAAFGALSPGVDPVEGDLVRGLRCDSSWIPELSLVAERPSGDSDALEIVGHVVCSRGSIGDIAAPFVDL